MKKKRNALTLIEIMLVIILVGIVGGALAFNLKGAVQKGKRFKTEETKKKIDAILNLALLEGHSSEEVKSNWIEHVKDSPLIKTKPNQTDIWDGWGKPFEVDISEDGYTLVSKSENIQIDLDEEELF